MTNKDKYFAVDCILKAIKTEYLLIGTQLSIRNNVFSLVKLKYIQI